MIKQSIPINNKFMLTVSEASEYFNIGRDKIYQLTREHGDKFAVHNGRSVLIKRSLMEDFLSKSITI